MRVNKLSQMSRTTETWTNNPRGKEITERITRGHSVTFYKCVEYI